MLKLTRPLVFVDLETTGIDLAKDRIVEIGIVRLEPDGQTHEWVRRINPLIPIPKEASAIHGIYDQDVANEKTFAELADQIEEQIENVDLAGYNSNNFDIPILMEEFLRIGKMIDLQKINCIDVMTIFKKKESRSLEAAVKFYCNRTFENAHSALDDARATKEVFLAQLEKYQDLPKVPKELADYTAYKKSADLAGKLLYDQQGDVIFTFGKYRRRKVKDVFQEDPGYYKWIMGADFPAYTKYVLTAIWKKM